MKKKVAIVLSAILACSMSMGVMAAPSPSIQSEPIAQVVVSSSVAENSNTVAAQATGVKQLHFRGARRHHLPDRKRPDGRSCSSSDGG